MTTETVAFETGHGEMIHDAQMDYYGKILATASSDRTIKLFRIVNGQQQHITDLKGHEGPVWKVSWAHPKFGKLLASCSYDKTIMLWKEENGQWFNIHKDQSHQASVNSVCWAPADLGLILTAASADGTISILTYENSQWTRQHINQAHPGGVNAVSWAPSVQAGSLLKDPQQKQPGQQAALVKRFVSGGCDNSIKVWRFDQQQGWLAEASFPSDGHSDWVRDVAWAPSLGLPSNTIASCSEDKTVIIWSESQGQWKRSHKLEFDFKVWTVSWSVMGNILAVATGDNKVSLWKESLDGRWQNLTELSDQEGHAE